MAAHDEVDRIVEAWLRERPDLDFSPLQVLSRVGRLAKHLDRARRAAFTASGLDSWEFDVLSALRRAGAPYQLSPKALLQQTLVPQRHHDQPHRPARRPRLVSGAPTRNDGRGILVVMTTAGQTRVDAAISQLVDAEAELLGNLSKRRSGTPRRLLRKLSLDFD